MEKTKVYDLPTRLFHWIFAGLFLGAFAIAKLSDDDSPLYPYHMMMGILLGSTVIVRIVWGFVGSRYARFSSFKLKPTDLGSYFRELLFLKTKRDLGHNPASSWAAITMMLLALGLGLSGYLMTQSHAGKETFEEVHELLANAFILVAILHVTGVFVHSLKHKDGIALAMIHGKKDAIEGAEGIQKTHKIAALVFLAMVMLFAFHLNRNYDPQRQSLNLFGATLQLGESEDEEREGHGSDSGGESEDDDDDDDD